MDFDSCIVGVQIYTKYNEGNSGGGLSTFESNYITDIVFMDSSYKTHSLTGVGGHEWGDNSYFGWDACLVGISAEYSDITSESWWDSSTTSDQTTGLCGNLDGYDIKDDDGYNCANPYSSSSYFSYDGYP